MEELAPIDGLIPPPVFDWTPLLIGGGLFGAALLIGLAVWFARSRKPALPRSPLPRRVALTRLEALREFIGSRTLHDFAAALSEILRQYISAQFGFRMSRLTTPEFLALAARSAFFSRRENDALEDFLTSVDALRFGPEGGFSGDESATLNEQLLAKAVAFVQGDIAATHAGKELEP